VELGNDLAREVVDVEEPLIIAAEDLRALKEDLVDLEAQTIGRDYLASQQLALQFSRCIK